MPGRAHQHLLEIQRGTLRGLKREIRRHLGHLPVPLRNYYNEYKGEFRQFRRLVTKVELIDAVKETDIVFVGDYHTLKQAQKTNIKLLRDIVPERRNVVLGVEMVLASQQGKLDAYLRGEIGDEAFLREIDWAGTWGFPWEPYRTLLAFAREHGLRVVALNSGAYDDLHRLGARDRFAARRIADAVVANPGALVYVVFGDLHVARRHLPRLVEEQLARRGRSARRIIVYQNSETLYWRLAESGSEHDADVLEMGDGVYCVMNTPPWIKLQSYLSWFERGGGSNGFHADDDDESVEEAEIETFHDEVYACIDQVAGFLDLPREGLHDVTVSTLDDLEFVRRLKGGRVAKSIERLIVAGQSFYVGKLGLIYLPAHDLGRAAEEAAAFLASRGGLAFPFDQSFASFLGRVGFRALGFFASKVVNHKRKCAQLTDFKAAADGGARGLSRRERAVARAVLQALPALRRGEVNSAAEAQAIRRDTRLGLGVSRAIGLVLGDALFRLVIDGEISRAAVRELYLTPAARRSDFRERALELWRRVRSAVAGAESKDDVF